MDRIWAGAAGVAVLAFLTGSVWFVAGGRGGDVFAECRTSQIAGGPGLIGGPFSLVDENGKTVTEAQVLSKPSLVYFGYSFCPDVCPFDNARNAEAIDLLAAKGLDVQPVFITIDPARDTPEVLAEFTENLHPQMLGLTGTQSQIDVAIKAYKAYGKKREDGDPEFYLMDHSTFTYLMLPGSGFADFYRRETTPQQMADSVGCFVEKMPES
ncbi:SCO family protein [Neogemmobacter tilapiae]|uniref:Protein senC n=1 Tax=Neogemmobacter tilapiae TaxID=875041 RepID=A0A918WIS4_9RHOB|nr:SCO family protein [Gemmobacter tilapiae]GHC51552.1 protein senC [Gemmobacter tilapiae]